MSKALLTKVVMYPDRVNKRIDGKRARVLFKLGAYLRTTMQRSMRYSNKPSQPGKPPHAHKKTGAHLRKRIRFNVDLAEGSVVCGPDLKPDSHVQALKPLPELLNNGGVIQQTIDGVGRPPVTRRLIEACRCWLASVIGQALWRLASPARR